MGVATCYINIFIANILDHACTAFFIHTLYTDVVLQKQATEMAYQLLQAALYSI